MFPAKHIYTPSLTKVKQARNRPLLAEWRRNRPFSLRFSSDAGSKVYTFCWEHLICSRETLVVNPFRTVGVIYDPWKGRCDVITFWDRSRSLFDGFQNKLKCHQVQTLHCKIHDSKKVPEVTILTLWTINRTGEVVRENAANPITVSLYGWFSTWKHHGIVIHVFEMSGKRSEISCWKLPEDHSEEYVPQEDHDLETCVHWVLSIRW